MIGLLACLASLSSAFAADAIPTGKLNVDRSLVRVGSRSQLDWQISYPNTAVVDVSSSGTITPKSALKMRVRVLGVAFQSGSTLLALQGSWSKNGGTWSTFFTGTGPTVVPTNVLVDTTVNQGDQVSFRGRGASNATATSWYGYHQTGVTDPYCVVLKNGDRPPSYAPAYDQGTVKSFMTPYLDSTGKIKIGAQDLMILWEASTAAPGTSYFDMQDLVVLVSFEKI